MRSRTKFAMVRTMVEVTLEDFSTQDLLDELVSRGEFEPIRKILKELDVPDDIVAKIEQWVNTPVVNEEKMEKWKRFCGVKEVKNND